MANTKYTKKEFSPITYFPKKEVRRSTQGIRQERTGVIKMTKKGTEKNTFYGCRKENFSDQKMKKAYRKINKMLGGN